MGDVLIRGSGQENGRCGPCTQKEKRVGRGSTAPNVIPTREVLEQILRRKNLAEQRGDQKVSQITPGVCQKNILSEEHSVR